MPTSIRGTASQAYTFFLSQIAQTQGTPQAENSARESDRATANKVANNTAAVPPLALNADTISDQTFSTLLKAQEDGATEASDDSASATTPTAKSLDGQEVDLDAYYANDPKPLTGHLGLDALADKIILPTAENIEAITAHVSVRFNELLQNYGIPEAPAQITYDNEGQLQLPADYPYADQLKQALDENPGVAHELHDLSAIADQYVGMQKAFAAQEELSQAQSQAEADAILAKYADLFSHNAPDPHIALNFSDTGALTLTTNGEPVAFA